MTRRMILVLSLLVATAWSLRSVAEAPPMEYVDHRYQFAFQFPADWKIEKTPPPGEADGVRVVVRHPTKPIYVMTQVGDLGNTITKREFESSPNRDAVIETMMALTIEQVYKKVSQRMGAERMFVSEKRVQPSEAGIQFYISTGHIKDNAVMVVAGMHIMPFEKSYMVTFTMVTPLDPTATKDNETITRVFNSFHVLGERPIK